MNSNHRDLVARNKATNLASWIAQNDWNPLSMTRAEGVYFWDADGNKYLDWSSQLMNVNIGHGHPHVLKAIENQIRAINYAHSGIATEARAALAEQLCRIVPGGMAKVFFTLGGADAIENSLKIARLASGRQKVLTRYRSYHGSTFGAMSAGGDPRRLANEPGVPWIVRFHDPYAYRSPIYKDRTQDEGDEALGDLIEQTVLFEGPDNVAAILLEGYSGSSGIIQGGEVFWRRIQEICDKYGILLVIDEIMSGFGRTGEWFGVSHYPFLKPDVVAMAKGITSGYVPLGAVAINQRVADYFEDNIFWGGLTYGSHPLGCAAGKANIEVIRSEKLIENSREMGKALRSGLTDLGEQHPSVGDVRGDGLHQVIELVNNRETKEPMNKFNQPLNRPMQEVARSLQEMGLNTFVKWNWIFCTPPLVISESELQEGLSALDTALEIADSYCVT